MNLLTSYYYKIFRILSRFLQTDTDYLLRGSALLTIGKSIGSIAALLLSIAYARYLPKELYGDYRYILSIVGMLGIFALPGMATALIRSVARGHDGALRSMTRIIFLSSLGIAAASLISAGIFFQKESFTLAYSFLAISCIIPFAESFGTWRGYWNGKKDFKTLTFYNIVSHIIYGLGMLGTVAGIALGNLPPILSVVMLTSAYYITRALPNVFFYMRTIRTIPTTASEEPCGMRYGFHLSLVDIPATIANNIDSVLLYTYLGPASLATYSFAIVPIEQLKGLLGTVATASFPKMAEKSFGTNIQSDLKKTLPKKLFKASGITAFIVLVYIVAAPLLFPLLFPQYVDAIPYSQVFALSLIFFPLGLFNTAMKAEGDLKKIYLYSIGVPLIQIALLAVFIFLYGLWGAIIGRIIGRLVNHGTLTILYFLPRTGKHVEK